jgi:competence protein ComEC
VRVDLRLLLPAAACWLAAALAPGLRPAAALWAVPVLVAAAAVLLARHHGTVLAAALLAAAAGLCATGVRELARASGPLPTLASAGADVVLRLHLSGDPVRRDGIGATGRPYHLMIIPAQATRVATDDGRAWTLRQPVLVLADDTAGWSGLLPSQDLDAAGDLSPPRPGDDVTAVLDARGPPSRVGPPSSVQRVAGQVRAGLRRASAPLPGQAAALLPALVDGDTSGLTSATEHQFRITGLTHLVAVSGENLAVVTGVTLGVVRRLRFGPRATAVVTACAIAGFVVLARPSPSVLRAAVMGAIGLAALAGGRPRPALASLSAATLLLVLADPSLARQAGFALSVLASLGLLVLAPGLAARFARRMPAPVATAIAVPVAAQLACTPVIAAIGGGLGVVAVPANLLAAPAVAPATVLGVLAAVSAPVSGGLARVLALGAWLPCRWLIAVAALGSRIPAATVTAPTGLLGAACGSLLVAVVLAVPSVVSARRRRVRSCPGDGRAGPGHGRGGHRGAAAGP